MDTATNYRYIVRTEGVRGGAARVEGTRIGVHDVAAYVLLGRDVDGIQAAFPISAARRYSSAWRIMRIIELRSRSWRFLRSSRLRSEVFFLDHEVLAVARITTLAIFSSHG